MPVWITGRNIEIVQNFCLFDQPLGDGNIGRQIYQELGDHVPPGLLTEVKMQGHDCLLGRLVGRQAGSFVAS